MARVEIGRIVKAHGLRGEVVVAGVRLDAEAFRSLDRMEARLGEAEPRLLAPRAVRPFVHNWLVTFEGVDDRDQAQALHGAVLSVDASQLPAAGEGQVYLFQLEGLAVTTEDGGALGRVEDVMTTGAAPILVVRSVPAGAAERRRERLIPMSPDIVRSVDLEGGTIVVRLLPGMDELS